MPVFVVFLAAALLLSVSAAVLMWKKILRWAENHLFPWVETNIPWLAPYVRGAFVAVDKVAAPVLKAVKDSWKQLRRYIIQQTEEFERQTSSQWVMRVTAWVREKLGPIEQEGIIKIVTEETIPYEDLPSEVREQWLRQGVTSRKINVTKLRDHELQLSDVA